MLSYKIENQNLVRLDSDKIIADSQNVVQCVINFESPWDELNVCVHFMNGNFVKSVFGIESGIPFFVPWEVLHQGNLRVYVDGFSVKTKIVTAPSKPVRIYPSGIFPPIHYIKECTKSLIDQVMSAFSKTEKRVDDLYDDVEAGIFDGKLEYDWKGTSLGIRRKGETEYQYSDLHGDKGDKGESGVYVGSGDMPEGYNVQIDPDGKETDLVTRDEADSSYASKALADKSGMVGLVRIKSQYGISLGRYDNFSPIDGDTLLLIKASESDIDSRSGYCAITPKNLDYAIKSALTSSTVQWTQEEKDKALTFLGIKEYLNTSGGNK